MYGRSPVMDALILLEQANRKIEELVDETQRDFLRATSISVRHHRIEPGDVDVCEDDN